MAVHRNQFKTTQPAAGRITPEKFLSGFPPTTQALAQRLRVLIKNKSHYFCFIAPLPDGVVLGFEYGIFISDPEGLLQGEGKQVRQLTVKSQKGIRSRKFAAFIKEAAELAALPKRELVRKQLANETAAIPHSSC